MASVESESDPSLRHQQSLFLQHLKANLEDQVGDRYTGWAMVCD